MPDSLPLACKSAPGPTRVARSTLNDTFSPDKRSQHRTTQACIRSTSGQAAESVNATIQGAASPLTCVDSFSLRTYQLLDELLNFRTWEVMTCIARLLVPELQVAVGALKVVIELELKRRDNDKEVNFVFLEMENMMSALLEYGFAV